MKVSFNVPKIRGACAVGLLLLWQQAAHSQTGIQTQAAMQEMPSRPPTLRQAAIPDALAGVPFHVSIQAADGYGAVTMTLRGALPSGLTMETGAKTLAISGVPEAAGTFEMEVTATDTAGNVARESYMVRVLPRPLSTPPTAIITDAETLHTTDTDHVFFPVVIKTTETIAAADADNVFMPIIINVHEGITAADADNHFSPAAIADPETIHTADADVVKANIGIIPNTAPAATYNVVYGQTFTPAGNTGTATFTPTGTLPTGLSFVTSTGQIKISGVPTQTGTFPFTLKVVDSGSGGTSTISYSLVVNPASQSITIGTIPSVTYGAGSFSLSATASPSGLPVTITSTSSLVSGSNPFAPVGAGTATFQATQAGNANYAAASPVNFNVNIAKAGLAVTANNATRAFDQPNPTFSYGLSNFVNGDNASVVSGTPAITATATPVSPVSGSPYGIVPALGTLTAANYSFNFVNGSLTLIKAPQTITFYPIANLTHGTTFPLSARSSSGLPVTYTVSGPATITNNILSVTGTGAVQITAAQAGNGNYSAATSLVRSFIAQ